MATLRLRSPLYQLHMSAWLLVIAGSIVLNLVHNQGSKEGVAKTLLVLFIVGAGALLRCWRLRLDVRGDEIVIRNWFRTRTIQGSDVTEVVLKAYDGLWSRSYPYNWITCLALTTGRQATVTAWGLVHTRDAGTLVARRLAEQLSVPMRNVDKWGREGQAEAG